MSRDLKKVDASEPKMVRVFSTREGKIVLGKDLVLAKNDVLLVTEEMAEYLEKTFKGMVRRVG